MSAIYIKGEEYVAVAEQWAISQSVDYLIIQGNCYVLASQCPAYLVNRARESDRP